MNKKEGASWITTHPHPRNTPVFPIPFPGQILSLSLCPTVCFLSALLCLFFQPMWPLLDLRLVSLSHNVPSHPTSSAKYVMYWYGEQP